METNANRMNNRFQPIHENIRNVESIIRLIFSALLISMIFVYPDLQQKMLYVVPALYLFTSALMKWDPLYAGFKSIRNDRMPTSTSIRMEAKDIQDAASGSNSRASNDPHRSEDRLKKAG